jgi:hypothetical protein
LTCGGTWRGSDAMHGEGSHAQLRCTVGLAIGCGAVAGRGSAAVRACRTATWTKQPAGGLGGGGEDHPEGGGVEAGPGATSTGPAHPIPTLLEPHLSQEEWIASRVQRAAAHACENWRESRSATNTYSPRVGERASLEGYDERHHRTSSPCGRRGRLGCTGGAQFPVQLPRPLGIVFAEKKNGDIRVDELVDGGNAATSGKLLLVGCRSLRLSGQKPLFRVPIDATRLSSPPNNRLEFIRVGSAAMTHAG